ncbi:hypothetical protein CCZ01_05465 [Helicobacter monodelphidis]|uniref:metal ABC transporter solute-binding protein, Zn/Mn family n=1 Tax=Helicobacter sp. 15-1451 TaxID=2004995 RepID=UPI000DCDC978|nr:zinc ABC transporter substrate-binding protein [Helicobacter sp. 15-1451]RAX57590.1 hypothetical protein CCZ01_05465 [Helicobacter sp. 15-1451]
MTKYILFVFLCLFQFGYTDSRPHVFMSIQAQEFWTKKIVQDKVKLTSLIQSGYDAHTYEPKPIIMQEMADSPLFLAIGVEFERIWLKRFSSNNPQMKIVKTQSGVRKIGNHQHGHGHSTYDPHIWLNVQNVKMIAQNSLMAIIQIDPQNKDFYLNNYKILEKELDMLYTQLQAQLTPVKRRTFMVLHPSWGYFAAEFGFTQLPIEIDGREPRGKELNRILKIARQEKITLIVTQKGYSDRVARQIAQDLKIGVVELDPLGGEWEQNMRKFATILTQVAS